MDIHDLMHFYNLKMRSIIHAVLAISILILSVFTLNMTLPQLIKTQWKHIDQPALNVSIGEKFAFALPSFDSFFDKESLKIYELNKDQYSSVISLMNFQNDKNKEIQLNAGKNKQITQNQAPFTCSLSPAKAQIGQQFKSVHQQLSRIHNNIKYQQNQFIHLPFKSLFYVLNPSTSQLSAYYYTDVSFDYISTHKFFQLMDHTQNAGMMTSGACMAASSIQDYIYIFTNIGIWEVNTKTILANVKKIDKISGFQSIEYGGVDKVLHGDGHIMIALKRMLKVFIIPEPRGSTAGSFREITHYKDEVMTPQDVKLVGNTLYVLDFYKGIYIFKIIGKGEPSEHSFIPFTNLGGNYQLEIYMNTIFITYNDFDGSRIVQISFNQEDKTSSLVRYFKEDSFISSLRINTVLTALPTTQIKKKYSQQAFQTLLFYISNNDEINIYPFNVDPRIINKAINGVKLRITNARHIYYINGDHFVIVTSDSIKYLSLKIQKPIITCKTTRSSKDQSYSASDYYKFTYNSNTSSCDHRSHLQSQAQKTYYNSYCDLTTYYFLHINDPQSSEFEKMVLYGAVFLVVVLVIAGLFCLIQWRQNKMVLLGRLKDQIMRFRNRHKQIQPFVQENIENKEIEIEVPQVPPQE